MANEERRRNEDGGILWWVIASLCVVVTVVLGVVVDNPGEVQPRELVRPLAILSLVAVTMTLGCRILYRPLVRIVPLALYLLFLFGSFKRVWGGELTAVLVTAAVLVIFFLWLRDLPGRRVARVSLLISAVMALGTTIAAAPSLFGGGDQGVGTGALRGGTTASPGPAELPDILYVVPDRYAGRRTLARDYDYDNDRFYRQLEERGFVVQPDAWANYPQTFQSLASTLNSTYLDRLSVDGEWRGWDRVPVHRLLEDNDLQARLRELGYDYLHMAGWWEPTRRNRHADENDFGARISRLSRLWPSEFERALWAGSPLPGLDPSWTSDDCTRLKRQLERLGTVGDTGRPVFVFAHLLIPHGPILTDADGDCLQSPIVASAADPDWGRFQQAYVGYLEYFNRVLIGAVDEQRDRRGEGGRELVVVLQSDEGPYPRTMVGDHEASAFDTLTPDEVRRKLGILNAVLLPGAPLTGSDLATPINNWRLVLNHLVGQGLELLPHRVYLHRGPRRLYEFVDVTGIAEGEASSGDPEGELLP